MSNTTPTRERIVDEAMRLFSQHGYAATSIARIEAAAGLTPGAGGLYHHFKSKEAVSPPASSASSRDSTRSARSGACSGHWGTSRGTHPDRSLHPRRARQRVRAAAHPRLRRTQPAASADGRRRAARQLHASQASPRWIAERAERAMPAEEAKAIAVFGLGSLLSSRLLRDVLGVPAQVDDEALVDAWVQMMATAMTKPSAGSDPDAEGPRR